MKFPQIPPDWQPVMDQAFKDGRAHDFFQFGQAESLRTDRYPHWDDFRHRTGTKGNLTAEQQWAAIRMGRAFRSQPIPLCDLQGKLFTFFLTQRAFEILHEIDLHCGGGIGVAEFFSISHEILKAPKQYYRAFLHTETDGNDLNYFIHHQLEIIRASILSLQEYIGRKQAEVETLRRHLGADSDFNHRQLALLKHALKHPFSAYTVVSHQTSHAISNQTAKNDLAALESKGLLQRGKVGKAFVYRPDSDLAGKLGA